MYADLLASLLRERIPTAASREGLVALALSRRARIVSDPENSRDVASRVAREIDYDCALVSLCRAMGIDAQASAFERPRKERIRLEGALRLAGIDLKGSAPRLGCEAGLLLL